MGGWPSSSHHRARGLQQATAALPSGPPQTAVGSGAPATGCAPTHTLQPFSRRGPQAPLGLPVDSSSSGVRGTVGAVSALTSRQAGSS